MGESNVYLFSYFNERNKEYRELKLTESQRRLLDFLQINHCIKEDIYFKRLDSHAIEI